MSKPIYPDYKGNYKGKLLQPILNHTKVRRPMSKWRIVTQDYRFDKKHFAFSSYRSTKGLVQDIKRIHKISNGKLTGKTIYPELAEILNKPSLLTRIKRIRRKKI